MAAAKKATPNTVAKKAAAKATTRMKALTQVSSHQRRTVAGMRAQAENPAQCALQLEEVREPKEPQPLAQRLCGLAGETLAQRGEEYAGQGAERQFHKVAGAFNSLTGNNITSHHVAMILMLVKAARMENHYTTTGKLHLDSAVDGPAYFALTADEIMRQHREALFVEEQGE